MSLDIHPYTIFVPGGWNTIHVAHPCQFSGESDALMVSSGAVDVGLKGENINFLTLSSHFASFSTNCWSIYNF